MDKTTQAAITKGAAQLLNPSAQQTNEIQPGQVVDAVKFAQQLDLTKEIPVPTTGVWEIKTKNSTYTFDADAKTMKGGVLGDTPVPGSVHGMSFGGSMMKPGFIMVGTRLEFFAAGDYWTSSAIQSIAEVAPLTTCRDCPEPLTLDVAQEYQLCSVCQMIAGVDDQPKEGER